MRYFKNAIAAFSLAVLLFTFIQYFLPDGLSSGVILYDKFLSAMLALATIWVFYIRKRFVRSAQVILIILFASVSLNFILLGPVAMQRSLSLYLLQKISAQGGVATKDEMIYAISVQYPAEMDVYQQRLTEQIVSGNIILEGNEIKLTNSGRAVLWISKIINRLFVSREM